MKQILLVKIDGIGDYLFFRLFWPQLAELGKKQNITFDFMCSPACYQLAEKYDRRFMRRLFYPCPDALRRRDRWRSFLRKYRIRYQKALQYQTCLKEKWDAVFNLQAARFLPTDLLMNTFSASEKGAVCGNGLYMGALEQAHYDRFTYTVLSRADENLFITQHLRLMLEDFLHASFECPAPALPFGRGEISEMVLHTPGLKTGEPYIVFVPYTSSWFKNWDIKKFIYLAQRLQKTTHLKIVLLGTAPGGCSCGDWACLPNVINLLDKTTLDDALKLAAGAQYAVCSDTSLMHAALVGGAQCVCISCGLYNRMFLNYPDSFHVKQKIFTPPGAQAGLGGFSGADINTVSEQDVWNHIRTHWRL